MSKKTAERFGQITRKTKETDISVELGFDGRGRVDVDTGVPFLDHMLTLFAVHGFFDVKIVAQGDTEIDDHHTVEDIGICLGQAIDSALGDKTSIARYGMAYLPMDEALARVVIDASNRPFLHYQAEVREPKLGTFDTMLVKEFFRAVCHHAGLTMHIDVLHGENGHHIIEAVFKGFGRALNAAGKELAISGALSSKGSL
jgi:imidazoleglycerol-phosphate dehydratase